MSAYDPKPFWQSRTIVGSVLALIGGNLPVLLPLLGVDPEMQDALTSLVVQIGAVLALYGRANAKRGLK